MLRGHVSRVDDFWTFFFFPLFFHILVFYLLTHAQTLNFQWHQLCNFEDVFVLPVSLLLIFLVFLALLLPIDVFWRGNGINSTRDDYLDIVRLCS